MFKKNLFRLVTVPVFAAIGVLATNQVAQAGFCVYDGVPEDECAQFYDPNFGPICINDPVDPTWLSHCVYQIQ